MIKVKQLPDQPASGVMLHCPHCWNEYSACKGDYFLLNPNTPMTCGDCDVHPPLRLVRKRTVYEEVPAHAT